LAALWHWSVAVTVVAGVKTPVLSTNGPNISPICADTARRCSKLRVPDRVALVVDVEHDRPAD
jgi:hypothetical protein